MKASIIVPMYGKWDLVNKRIAEFYHFLSPDCEIIVVDDASPELEREKIENGVSFWTRSAAHFNRSIRFIRNRENLGFSGAMNVGADSATGDILIFYSNDVVASGDFLTPLKELFGEYDESILVGHRLVNWSAGWNEFDLGKHVVVPYLEGYFIACRREDWDVLGGWDTRYGKYDYEDMDLSMAASMLGFKLVEFRTPLLFHIGGATIGYSQERMEHTQRNRLIFIEKWKDVLSE